MSEIKALEKMRKYVSEWWAPDEAVNEDVNNFADEIQAEVDERFMELPLDADGVPIHVGDLVALNYGEPFKVGGIRDAGNQWHIFRYELNRWWSPLDLHHVKPRTLEDVLCDLEGMRGNYADYEDVVCRAAKYAAEIRELLGVER